MWIRKSTFDQLREEASRTRELQTIVDQNTRLWQNAQEELRELRVTSAQERHHLNERISALMLEATTLKRDDTFRHESVQALMHLRGCVRFIMGLDETLNIKAPLPDGMSERTGNTSGAYDVKR